MKLLTSNLKHFMLRFHFIFILSTGILSTSIAQKSEPGLLNDSLLQHAHIGICIYDPAANKYLYQHDANKYFVPASNTKLFTLYAGLKYLGDSITGLKYQYINDSSIEIYPTGDPTFMHPAFPIQPVYDFLCNKRSVKIAQWDTLNEYAPGWAWEDQQEDYMIPKNPFPIYGNLLNITLEQGNKLNFSPDYFRSKTILGDNIMKGFSIMKIPGENSFRINNGKKTKASANVTLWIDRKSVV